MSRKTSNVFRTSFLTMDGTLDPNNSQLFFRPLQAPLNTTDNSFYSLGAAQSNDPSLRINKYDSNGQLERFGYLYDTAYNPPPPAKFIIVAGGTGPYTPLIYSQDRESWNYSQYAELFLTSCLAIAYDGFIWVAGGIGSRTVLYSSNGTTWADISGADVSGAADILSGQCSAIATNGDFWIAGGRSNVNCAMCFSYDLITWYNTSSIIVPIFDGGSVACIAYNGFLWLAGGNNVTGTIPYSIAYSNDGIYWTGSVQAQPLLDECYALCWNGSLWLAGGNFSGVARILYSIDGSVWIVADLNGSIPTSVRAIGWNGTVLVAGGYDSSSGGRTLAYSYDGITWSASPSNIFTSLCDTITWDGITWQAGGEGGIYTSPDGIIWRGNGIVQNYLPQVNAIAINKILPLVAPKAPVPDPTSPLTLVGGRDDLTGCTIAYSTDGITWKSSQQVASVFGNAFANALCWNGSLWTGGFDTCGGLYPSIGYSYDGITWNGSSSGSAIIPDFIQSIAWGVSFFLAYGYTGSVYRLIRSTDGITWTDVTPVPFNIEGAFSSLQYIVSPNVVNGSLWILIGSGSGTGQTINYSVDGINWNNSVSGSAIFTTCSAMAWNGRILTAAGRNSSADATVAYSSDGINWIEGTLTYDPGTSFSIAWNEILFVIASSLNLGYSYDGITWYPADEIPITPVPIMRSVTWTGTLWTTTGYIRGGGDISTDTGVIFYSYNGTTWYNSYNGSNIVTNQGRVIAANRVNPYNGSTLPPPVLNQGITIPNGYGIITSNANNLYKSSKLYINDASGVLGINQTTLNYTDMTSVSIGPVVEISGGGITVNTYTSNAIPGLYLTASNISSGSGNSAGRVELYDAVNQFGWQIDNNVGGFNRLKIQSKSSTNPVQLAMDIRNSVNTIGIGVTADSTNRLTVQGDVLVTGDLYVNGTKSFLIDHPNPALKETHSLRHCCVEGPTRGDTLYRWTLVTSNGSCVQALPSYSVHLNENWQFFVSAKNSFGTGYAILSQDERTFTLFGSEDGPYSVVGVATRKDKAALVFDKKGVEALKE